jgi:hypothetical protein
MGAIISYILNAITFETKTIQKWVGAAISAAESFLETWIRSLFQNVSDALEADARSIEQIDSYIVTFSGEYNVFRTITFPAFVTWSEVNFATVIQDMNKEHSWAAGEFTRVELAIIADVLKLTEWVLSAVFAPLDSLVMQALGWIEKEGAYIWNLITHPELLLKLLGSWLWLSFVDLLKAYSGPIANWLLHSMLGEADTFADVLETIISHLV